MFRDKREIHEHCPLHVVMLSGTAGGGGRVITRDTHVPQVMSISSVNQPGPACRLSSDALPFYNPNMSPTNIYHQSCAPPPPAISPQDHRGYKHCSRGPALAHTRAADWLTLVSHHVAKSDTRELTLTGMASCQRCISTNGLK